MTALRINTESPSMTPQHSAQVIDFRRNWWALLRVKPNMERKVVDRLTEEGLQVYAPIEKFKPANHWKPRTRPLLRGYIFAHLPDDDALDLARSNKAVIEVMKVNGADEISRCRLIPPMHVAWLIVFEACHAFDTTWKPPKPKASKRRGRRPSKRESRWVSGQRVKVKGGPMEGFIGTVMRTDRGSRIDVVLKMFGGAISAEVGDEELEEAPEEVAS